MLPFMTGEQLRKLRHELLAFVAEAEVDLAAVVYFESPTGVCHFPVSRPGRVVEVASDDRRCLVMQSGAKRSKVVQRGARRGTPRRRSR